MILDGTVSGRAREDNFQAYGAGFTLLDVETVSVSATDQSFIKLKPFLVRCTEELTNESRGTLKKMPES